MILASNNKERIMVMLQRSILLIALLGAGCESMSGIRGPLALERSPQNSPTTVTSLPRLIPYEEHVITESIIWPAGSPQEELASSVSTEATHSKVSRLGNTFSTIFFPLDSWDITPEVRDQLDFTAQWMHCFPNSGLRIEAHTDVQGTESYKLVLGAKRAHAIKDYLSHLGIPAQRMETVSYGKEFMICELADDFTCQQFNRRAELLLEQRKFYIHTQSRKCIV
jgi:outer membrane protein OmpA-like peptidoglycan-associated protein